MSRPVPEGKLYYHGTDVDVRLGDRVELARWLRKPLRGTVIYIPGVSRLHKEMVWPEFHRWAVGFDDGSMLAWPFTPDSLQPEKRLTFIERGDPHKDELLPDEELE